MVARGIACWRPLRYKLPVTYSYFEKVKPDIHLANHTPGLKIKDGRSILISKARLLNIAYKLINK